MARGAAEVHQAAFGEQVNAACRPGRCILSYCGLMLSFLQRPWRCSSRSTWISLSKWPMLQTIAWSFIFSMCSSVMMSQLPVVVT